MMNHTCCNFKETILFYLAPPVLIAVFVLGLLFNGIALWVFCFHMKSWKPSTIWLFNLAMADFLLIICLPFRTDYYLKKKVWLYGDIPCRVMLFMLAMNRAGSIFFLSLVAVDRYFKVVYPHRQINSMSIKSAVCIACVIWLITISLTVYILAKSHSGNSTSSADYCDSFIVCPGASSTWHDILYIAEFLVPLCVVMYCSYSIIWRLRQRNLDRHKKIKKAMKCITLVCIVFFLCFLPSVSTRIEVLRLLASPRSNDCSIYMNVDTAFYITVCLTYMNSMCNPLIYFFSNPSFKAFYLKIMRRTNQSISESDVGQMNDSPNTFQSKDETQ
ncbi:hydroxycarboxylic acid receptor 2 [Rhinophrynus dorsalis]